MRKAKHYRRPSVRNSARNRNIKKKGVNLFTVAFVIVLAVFLGFMTTKFIVYPLVLGQEASFDVVFDALFAEDGDVSEKKEVPDNKSGDDVASDSDTQTSEESDTVQTSETAVSLASGYSIQFGAFTNKASAEELLTDLQSSGISANIVEKDGVYKVIGPLFATKEEALASKDAVISTNQEKYKDVFVVNI